ncbi:MAG: SdpI family protein [Lachnospiraceae bacterium]|nr:SdpI family protein [Lachnospiraceae bacterium]
MGFWLFIFISDLPIPLLMMGFGRYFLKSAPGSINSVFGYRTSMSMKNKDTWMFAHSYCGRVWFQYGLILSVLTIVGMICVIHKNEDVVSLTGGIICAMQLLFLVGSIVPTERALRRTFDKDGNRKLR